MIASHCRTVKWKIGKCYVDGKKPQFGTKVTTRFKYLSTLSSLIFRTTLVRHNVILENVSNGTQSFTINTRIWYLLHQNVLNPLKPEKFRVVYDCAAKHGQMSLNDNVSHGPDLTNNLLVLTNPK